MRPMRPGALALLYVVGVAGVVVCTTSAWSSPSPQRATRAALPATLLIRVIDSVARQPLPNAEVTAAPLRRLTDGRGEARFTWPEEGRLRVRVRQIGFRYVEQVLSRGSSTTASEDTVTIALGRAAFALPQVEIIAQRRCAPITDSATLALSTSTMDLLRFGAQQYESFRLAYPFDVTLDRHTRWNPMAGARARSERRKEETHSEGWGDRYRPTQVLQRNGADYFVPLLFVSTLADSVFWDRHCFVARGVKERDGRRMIQLDFSAARGIREVEWEGSAWLDSAAGVLRRVDFRLANLRYGAGPRRFEGYITFAVPSPYIAIPDSTVAWWSSRTLPPPGSADLDVEARQVIVAERVVYRGRVPPK